MRLSRLAAGLIGMAVAALVWSGPATAAPISGAVGAAVETGAGRPMVEQVHRRRHGFRIRVPYYGYGYYGYYPRYYYQPYYYYPAPSYYGYYYAPRRHYYYKRKWKYRDWDDDDWDD
jgi:hypothetical protein